VESEARGGWLGTGHLAPHRQILSTQVYIDAVVVLVVGEENEKKMTTAKSFLILPWWQAEPADWQLLWSSRETWRLCSPAKRSRKFELDVTLEDDKPNSWAELVKLTNLPIILSQERFPCPLRALTDLRELVLCKASDLGFEVFELSKRWIGRLPALTTMGSR